MDGFHIKGFEKKFTQQLESKLLWVARETIEEEPLTMIGNSYLIISNSS